MHSRPHAQTQSHARPRCGVRALAMALTLNLAAGATAAAPTASNDPATLARAVLKAADQIEQDPDDDRRRAALEQASREAALCLARAPRSGACQYAHALVLGLTAREHPLHFRGYLGQMLAALARAEAADPNYDFAGPERVHALVLLRAPRWPLGPGDPHGALAMAQRAVMLQSRYPPNWLALAEVQAKTGSASEARASYDRARALAATLPPTPDRDEWLTEAAQGLAR